MLTGQDGALCAPDNDEGHNNEDEVNAKNVGVAAEDAENAGVAAKEDLNEEEVFVDAA